MFPSALRVFVATAPVDFRVSFDRLAGIVRDQWSGDPRSGSLFVFVNKRKDRCKVLFYDRTGYCLLYKRLDAGTFSRPVSAATTPSLEIDGAAFTAFLEGIASEVNAHARRKSRRLH